jgi:cell division protein ZapA
MSHVSVTINGRQFRMACDDGQEDHLHRLSRIVNDKVDQLKGSFGEIGDTRLTVMAAIMVADDLAEMQRRMKGLEDEVASLREARSVVNERLENREKAFAEALAQTAEKIERIAGKLMTKSEG